MSGFLHKILNCFSASQDQPSTETEELEQGLNGFRNGYPLVGQPTYPSTETSAYRRGYDIGRTLFVKHRYPRIQFEPSETEEEQ